MGQYYIYTYIHKHAMIQTAVFCTVAYSSINSMFLLSQHTLATPSPAREGGAGSPCQSSKYPKASRVRGACFVEGSANHSFSKMWVDGQASSSVVDDARAFCYMYTMYNRYVYVVRKHSWCSRHVQKHTQDILPTTSKFQSPPAPRLPQQGLMAHATSIDYYRKRPRRVQHRRAQTRSASRTANWRAVRHQRRWFVTSTHTQLPPAETPSAAV